MIDPHAEPISSSDAEIVGMKYWDGHTRKFLARFHWIQEEELYFLKKKEEARNAKNHEKELLSETYGHEEDNVMVLITYSMDWWRKR